MASVRPALSAARSCAALLLEHAVRTAERRAGPAYVDALGSVGRVEAAMRTPPDPLDQPPTGAHPRQRTQRRT